MATKLKLKDNETATIEFTHLNGKEAKLYIAKNPLTGDWLESHTMEQANVAYYSTKKDCLRLANAIISKSEENELSCKVTVEKNPDIA